MLAVLLCIALATQSVASSPGGFDASVGSVGYTLEHDGGGMTVNDMESACQGLQGHLAKVENQAQFTAVKNLIAQKNVGPGNCIRMGATKASQSSPWRWFDGSDTFHTPVNENHGWPEAW